MLNICGYCVCVCVLQYHGGTNFGHSTGGPFIATSYDYDAPLDEYGMVNFFLNFSGLVSYQIPFSGRPWLCYRVRYEDPKRLLSGKLPQLVSQLT